MVIDHRIDLVEQRGPSVNREGLQDFCVDLFNFSTKVAEEGSMSPEGAVVEVVVRDVQIGPGTILVSRTGQIKILRSRNKLENGWNCADGAGIDDDAIARNQLWTPYTAEELAADLALAADLNEVRGHRVLGGGLSTWDACSGRPCVLPKLAKLVH